MLEQVSAGAGVQVAPVPCLGPACQAAGVTPVQRGVTHLPSSRPLCSQGMEQRNRGGISGGGFALS